MAKILVIDDEAAIRRILREILEHEKYNVDDAASAVERESQLQISDCFW